MQVSLSSCGITSPVNGVSSGVTEGEVTTDTLLYSIGNGNSNDRIVVMPGLMKRLEMVVWPADPLVAGCKCLGAKCNIQ